MTGDGRRTRRVADLLKSELALAISRFGDPELSALVLTEVTISDDLGVARIAVRLLTDDRDEQHRRALLGRLGRAQGRLRHLVGPKLRLRRTPELRFYYDQGPDAMRRVQELLDEISLEPKLPKDPK